MSTDTARWRHLKRDPTIPLAVIREAVEEMLAHHQTMRLNAIRARLGIIDACLEDLFDTYEDAEAEYE